MAGHDGRLVFLAQQFEERGRVAGREPRENDRTRGRANALQFRVRIEKRVERRAIGFEQRGRAGAKLREVIKGHDGHPLRRMRRDGAKEIVQTPDALRERGRGQNPPAAQSAQAISFR